MGIGTKGESLIKNEINKKFNMGGVVNIELQTYLGGSVHDIEPMFIILGITSKIQSPKKTFLTVF